MKIANRSCRQCVRELKPFKANNLYAEMRNTFYVVFSYGEHWPLWAYDSVNDKWLENVDKYSVSTSRHKSQTCPINDGSTVEVSVDELKNLIDGRPVTLRTELSLLAK